MLSIQANQRILKFSSLGVLVICTILFFDSLSQHNYFPSGLRKPADKLTTQLITPFRQHVSADYSIKPIVYIFPQYYPFEQNDRIWGKNFTEWDNVRKATHNQYGLETIRPHESIGYYNGLNFSTRQRHGRLIRDNGFYGLVYHHYWMSGTPVMDHILQAMLLDGEPNTPFMLSWANEPWTANWDGLDSGVVFLAQDYGDVTKWREHFDWLLPFFRHPNYIRSEGKVQFLLYWPAHMDGRSPGVRFHMLAAFRKWAIEEGLGGMDIIEARQGENPTFASADAINEFQPHTGGANNELHHLKERNSRIYHRGSLVCWDTTPRHATDGRAQVSPTCHPTNWLYHMVRLMGKIKADPNPKGAENFLFINALNEWGEGSALEPTVQFGTAYADAMKEAVRISEKKHIWQSQDIAEGLERTAKFNAQINKTVQPPDVCVLIQTSAEYGLDKRFNLDDMIRSLQSQKNRNWRAVVFAADGTDIGHILLARIDPRIKEVSLPSNVDTAHAYNWVIKNLTTADPSCASAKYMLITNGGNEYAPSSFDATAEGKADFLALNVESRWTIKDANPPRDAQHLCTRLQDPVTKLFRSSAPTASGFDLAATFISLPKFFTTLSSGFSPGQFSSPILNLTLSFHPSTSPSLRDPLEQEGGGLAELLVSSHGWSWAPPPNDDERHVLHNPSYTGCKEAGHIWVDSMVFGETGCYSTPDIGAIYGGWGGVDLAFYRAHGWCTKQKVASE